MPTPKAWQATYPQIGLREAMATVVALEDGSFLIAVAATDGAEDRRKSGTLLSRLYTALSEAQARADAMVVELLGREVVGKWQRPD